MITIVINHYGCGNALSVQNMLTKIGIDSYIAHSPKEIVNAKKIILPGVGSFDPGMTQLEKNGFVPILNELILVLKRPILGICLGMQLMTKGSEEGTLSGLGWINAETIKFKFESAEILKTPHVGWNETELIKNSKIFDRNKTKEKFYLMPVL